MSAPETALATAAATEAGLVLSIEKALALVEEAKTFPELKDIRDQAELLKGWARSRDASHGVQNAAAEIAVRATRKIGAILDEQKRTGERATPEANLRRGRPTTREESTEAEPAPPARPPTLAEMGIDKNLARRAQVLAKMPDEKFESYVRSQKEDPAGEITLAGAERVAKSKNPHAASRVNDGDPEKNVRFTHPQLAAELHRRFRFSVDAFGHPEAPITKLILASGGHFYTLQDDGFEQDYTNERSVFSNAEWDVLPEAVYLTHQQVEAGCPGWLHVLPTTQIGRRYWLNYIEPYRPDRGGAGVRLEASAPATGGRWNYGKPWDPKCDDPENKGVGMPTCLVIWEGERRRSPEFPPLVDCACGHQHSAGSSCPICTECRAGDGPCPHNVNDASLCPQCARGEPKAPSATKPSRRPTPLPTSGCQGSPRDQVHAFAFEGPQTLSRCGEVRRCAMLIGNIRGAPPNVCRGCRTGVDADVAEGSAVDGLTLRRKRSAASKKAEAPKVRPGELGWSQFLDEVAQLANLSGQLGKTKGHACVTVRCDAWKGWRCTKTWRFPLNAAGLVQRAELQQVQQHVRAHGSRTTPEMRAADATANRKKKNVKPAQKAARDTRRGRKS